MNNLNLISMSPISSLSILEENNEDQFTTGRSSSGRHGPRTIKYIEYVYITAMVFWILLIVWLQLYQTDTLGLIILLIPFISFGFGYFNSYYLNKEVEDYVFQNNYFSVGLLIILPLLTWLNREYSNVARRKRFTSILVTAIILIMFSLLDIWVPIESISVIKHLHSVLQTTAIIMLIYALYMFYIDSPDSFLR